MPYLPGGKSATLFHFCLRYPVVAIVMVVLVLSGFISQFHKEPCNGIVTLDFDGGYKSVIERALPLMNKYGYKGVVYATTGFIDTPGYMTWEDLLYLQSHKWEIGSFTVTAPDLTELNEQQVQFEIVVSKKMLESHGVNVQSFASPYGRYNNYVVDVARQYFSSHRTLIPGLNTLPLDERSRYIIKAVSVEDFSLEKLQHWILQAKQKKQWLVLVFGDIDDQTEQKLRALLKFLHNQGFKQLSFI